MGSYLSIAQSLAATIAAGTIGGQPINAAVMSGEASRLELPCVRVVPPAIGYDTMDAGFRVSTSEWTIHLYTGSAGEVDVLQDMDLLEAVEDALDADPTIGGACTRAYPTVALQPQPQTIAGQRGATRRLMVREMTIRMDH